MKQLTVPSSLLENGRCTSTRNDIITRWNINIGRSVARAKTSDSAVKYKVRRSNGIPSATFLDAAHAVYRLERYIYILHTARNCANTRLVPVYLCMPTHERRYNMDNHAGNATIARGGSKSHPAVPPRDGRERVSSLSRGIVDEE